MNFGWQNVVDGHGLGLMITGMLIVFCGLCLISGIIILMGALDGKKHKAKKASVPVDDAKADKEPTKEELIAVAALVVYLESERSMGELTLTLPKQSRVGSIWASAGKMRSLSEGGSYA